MADPTQLTTDGREEAILAPLAPRPCHEAPALFDPAPFAARVPGTMALNTDPPAPCIACEGLGYTRPFLGTGNPETRPCRRCGGTGHEPGSVDLGPLDCDLRPDLESAGTWDDDYLRSIL